MKIQIISEYFYPDNFRINDIVEQMVLDGHRVSVLTGLPDYTNGKIPKEYHWFRKRKEVYRGAKVRRVATIARRTGVLWRVLNYTSFIVTSFFYSLFTSGRDADLFFVYQTSPVFQGIPGVIWKKKTHKPLVLYCCDLWPESMKAWGVKEGSLPFKIVKKISRWIYQSCDLIAISSEPFAGYLTEVCGVDPERIVYLPQHAEDLYADIAGIYEENGVCDFLFAGNIGSVQNVDCILKATAQVDSPAPFHVHIVGDGSELNNLKELAQSLGITDKVTFHGRFPLREMERFYRMADCFLLTLRGGDFIGMTLPSKAQGYLSAGKPIAAAIDGAAYGMIHEADCGEAVPAGDAEGLARIMERIAADPARYREKGALGRRFYEENYTGEIFFRSYYEILSGQIKDN